MNYFLFLFFIRVPINLEVTAKCISVLYSEKQNTSVNRETYLNDKEMNVWL